MVLALLEYNALNYCSKLSKQIICQKMKKSKEINRRFSQKSKEIRFIR